MQRQSRRTQPTCSQIACEEWLNTHFENSPQQHIILHCIAYHDAHCQHVHKSPTRSIERIPLRISDNKPSYPIAMSITTQTSRSQCRGADPAMGPAMITGDTRVWGDSGDSGDSGGGLGDSVIGKLGNWDLGENLSIRESVSRVAQPLA